MLSLLLLLLLLLVFAFVEPVWHGLQPDQFTSQIPIPNPTPTPTPITHARHEPLLCLKVEHLHLSEKKSWMQSSGATATWLELKSMPEIQLHIARSRVEAVAVAAAGARPRQQRRHYINAVRLTFRWLNRRVGGLNNMRNMLINTRLTRTRTGTRTRTHSCTLPSLKPSTWRRLLIESPVESSTIYTCIT